VVDYINIRNTFKVAGIYLENDIDDTRYHSHFASKKGKICVVSDEHYTRYYLDHLDVPIPENIRRKKFKTLEEVFWAVFDVIGDRKIPTSRREYGIGDSELDNYKSLCRVSVSKLKRFIKNIPDGCKLTVYYSDPYSVLVEDSKGNRVKEMDWNFSGIEKSYSIGGS